VAFVTDENRRWWALGALATALFMIMLDNTVVALALPAIQRDLSTSFSQLEWVVNAYAMIFAVLLIIGGKLADYLGRRKIFLIGLVIFTASSLACGLASSGEALIAARAVQGIGGAMMLPATLSIVTATFPVHERGLAIGIWAGVSGIALAIGPLVGGLLVENGGWEWIFFINLPVGVIGTAATLWLVKESRDMSAEQRLDVPGLVTSGLGVFLLTFGLIEANNYGWGSRTIVLCFVGAALALIVFVLLELRQRLPMLDLSLFRNPTFVGGNIGGLLMFIALFGQIFYFSIYMQAVLGYSAAKAGATFIVATGAVAITAPIAGKLSDHIGARLPATIGMAMYGTAMLGVSRFDADTTFWQMAPWLLLGGLGFGAIMPPLTAAVMSSVTTDKAGVASAVMQSFRQLGAGLGVAVMGAIVVAEVGELGPGDPRYAPAYVPGFQNAILVTALLAFASAVLAFALIRTHVSDRVEAPVAGPV
jgi:EmrB/QacA subfamily drug resistance transporter